MYGMRLHVLKPDISRWLEAPSSPTIHYNSIVQALVQTNHVIRHNNITFQYVQIYFIHFTTFIKYSVPCVNPTETNSIQFSVKA